jgi:hypothetical protein
MSALKEVLSTVSNGDMFESGRMFKFSESALVWIVEEMSDTEATLRMYYQDIFVKEETIKLK